MLMSNESVERLRYAIVKQACEDFNLAYFERKRLERKAKSSGLTEAETDRLNKAQAMEAECLRFFYSRWYASLCSIDPEALISALKARRRRKTWDD